LRIERVGVQVKLQDPLRTHAIPERFRDDDSRKRCYIRCMYLFLLLTIAVNP